MKVMSSHLPQGRCGLKCVKHSGQRLIERSPSARKVWIEIANVNSSSMAPWVTFRKEGVDWNLQEYRIDLTQPVTFRKEGVDWNNYLILLVHGVCRHLPQGRCGLKLPPMPMSTRCAVVTFRKEGVDWNFYSSVEYTIRQTSPSAKKVWIEIRYSSPHRHPASVTFCKEGVDWNNTVTCLGLTDIVTFRKEGVDWN